MAKIYLGTPTVTTVSGTDENGPYTLAMVFNTGVGFHDDNTFESVGVQIALLPTDTLGTIRTRSHQYLVENFPALALAAIVYLDDRGLL